MKKNILLLFALITVGFNLQAQFKAPTSLTAKTRIFDRKVLLGVAFNTSWANYRDCKDSSFYRPSLGGGLRAEFYIKPYLGILIGAGIQQRGMGVYTRDLDNSLGNPDSTGRLRYRMTTFDFPVQLIYRHPKEILPNTRLSISAGVDFCKIYNVQRIWKSVEDGNNIYSDITKTYSSYDIPFRAGFGIDSEVGHGSLFRLQFYGEMSSKKLFTNPSTHIQSNQQILLGIDLSVLF